MEYNSPHVIHTYLLLTSNIGHIDSPDAFYHPVSESWPRDFFISFSLSFFLLVAGPWRHIEREYVSQGHGRHVYLGSGTPLDVSLWPTDGAVLRGVT